MKKIVKQREELHPKMRKILQMKIQGPNHNVWKFEAELLRGKLVNWWKMMKKMLESVASTSGQVLEIPHWKQGVEGDHDASMFESTLQTDDAKLEWDQQLEMDPFWDVAWKSLLL